MTDENKMGFEELFDLIKEKIAAKQSGSYSYELAKGGAEKTTRKVGEEAVEVVVAAFMHEKENSSRTRDDLIGEVSDLFYHSLVLLAGQDIELSEIMAEFNRRNIKLSNKV